MNDDREARTGALYALAAFSFWGMAPLYFKAVRSVPPLELLAHRVVWSLLLLGVLVLATGRLRAALALVRRPRTLGLLVLSTALVSSNWFVFIWAVGQDRVLETSLGYYINPLVNVLLGVVFLGERLGRARGLAVALAGLGALQLALQAGAVPWVSLVLAFTFGGYGLVRKIAALPSVEGLLLETALLAPLALGFLAWLGPANHFAAADRGLDALLVASGLVTAVPLVWFASAARRLDLSTVGFFQYLAPTLSFLLAVFAFGEPFTSAHFVTFALIWTALAIVAVQGTRRRVVAAA